MSVPSSAQGREGLRNQDVCPRSPRPGALAGPEFTESEPRAASTEGARPGPVVGNTCLLFCIPAFNIVLNFGIAVTYPTLMSLGIVLSVPVNAGRSVRLSAPLVNRQAHTHQHAQGHTLTGARCAQGHAHCPAQRTALGHSGDVCCTCNRSSITD